MTRLLPVLLALNMAVGSLCIAVLGLATHAIVVKDKLDPLLPSNMSSAGLGMLMWAGCGGIVDMLLFLCLIRAKPLHGKTGTPSRALYWRMTLFVAGFVVLRPLVVLSYTFATNSGITPEKWGCDIGSGSDAQALCRDLHTARYLLVPILVLAVVLLAATLWSRFRRDRSPRADDQTGREAQPRSHKASTISG